MVFSNLSNGLLKSQLLLEYFVTSLLMPYSSLLLPLFQNQARHTWFSKQLLSLLLLLRLGILSILLLVVGTPVPDSCLGLLLHLTLPLRKLASVFKLGDTEWSWHLCLWLFEVLSAVPNLRIRTLILMANRSLDLTINYLDLNVAAF